MRKIQARKTNGEGVAFVVVIFVLFAATLWLFHRRRRTAPLSHPWVPCVPHQPHRSRAAHHHGLPPGLGPQDPSVQPLAPHTHRALNWALFLSWILPCSMDPNFYSIPETFCSAFPPSSNPLYFPLFATVSTFPGQTPGIFLAQGETQNRLDAPLCNLSACLHPALGARIHRGGTPSPCLLGPGAEVVAGGIPRSPKTSSCLP